MAWRSPVVADVAARRSQSLRLVGTWLIATRAELSGPVDERAHCPEGDAVDRGSDRCEEPSADTGGGRDEAETAVDSQGAGGHPTATQCRARAAMMRDDDTIYSLHHPGRRVVSGARSRPSQRTGSGAAEECASRQEENTIYG